MDSLITDTHIHIAYSGGAAGGYSYVVGLLTLKRGDDLLNASNWSKSNVPALSHYSVEGEFGPGHHSFFQDNGNTMIAYHAQEQLINSPRCTAIRRVHFDIEGTPKFDLSEDRDLKDDLKKVLMKVVVRENLEEVLQL